MALGKAFGVGDAYLSKLCVREHSMRAWKAKVARARGYQAAKYSKCSQGEIHSVMSKLYQYQRAAESRYFFLEQNLPREGILSQRATCSAALEVPLH